jgi:hypothetical protein
MFRLGRARSLSRLVLARRGSFFDPRPRARLHSASAFVSLSTPHLVLSSSGSDDSFGQPTPTLRPRHPRSRRRVDPPQIRTPKHPNRTNPQTRPPSAEETWTHWRDSQPPQLETIHRHAETVQDSTVFPRGTSVRLGEFSADDLFLQSRSFVALGSFSRVSGRRGAGDSSGALRGRFRPARIRLGSLVLVLVLALTLFGVGYELAHQIYLHFTDNVEERRKEHDIASISVRRSSV